MNTSNNQLWVVACCFNEEAGITNFIEAVLAQPSVDRLLLIDDGSRDDSDTTGAIRRWMEAQPLASHAGGTHPQFRQRGRHVGGLGSSRWTLRRGDPN